MTIKNILKKRVVPGALAVMLLLSTFTLPAYSQEPAPQTGNVTQQVQPEAPATEPPPAAQTPNDSDSPAQQPAAQEPAAQQPAEVQNPVQEPVNEAVKLANAELSNLVVENGLQAQIRLNGKDYVPGQEIARDSQLSVALSYELSNDAKRTIDSSTVITYPLPQELKFADVPQKDIEDEGGTVIGTYSVENNELKFSYTDNFVTSSNITGFFRLDAKLTEVAAGGGETTDITFAGSNTTVTITLQDSIITGKKEYKVNNDGTLTFTVTLTVDAPATKVSLTDKLGSNFSYRANTLRVKTPDGTDVALTQDGKELPLTDPVFAVPEGGDAINGTQAVIVLGDLQAGTYVLTYDVDVVAGEKNKNRADYNYVEWKWTGRTEHTDNAECRVTDFGSQLSKTGTYDLNKGLLNWTVTVNGSLPYANMSGKKLYDVISNNQSYQGTISVYIDENKGTPYRSFDASTLKKESVDGTEKTVLFEFPEDAGAHRFYIVYSTKMEKKPQPGTTEHYVNTVQFDKITATKTISISEAGTGPSARIMKYKGSPNSGSSEYDRWINDITILNEMPAGMVFKDWLMCPMTTSLDKKNPSVPVWSKHLPDTLSVEYKINGTSEWKKLTEGTDYTKPEYRVLDEKDGRKTKNPYGVDTFTFKFLKTLAPGVVRVTYNTSTDWSLLPPQSQVQIKNYGRVEWAGGGHEDYEDYYVVSALEKTGTQAVWDPTVNDGNGGHVISWTVTANALPGRKYGVKNIGDRTLTVTDTLPEGLTYVQGSAQVTAYKADGTMPAIGYNDYKAEPDVTTGADGLVLTWNFNRSKNQWYTITFKTLVDPAKLTGSGGKPLANGDKISFVNNATMNVADVVLGKATGEGNYIHTVLEKTAKQVDGKSRAQYTIAVNTPSVKLNKGNPLTLTDIIPDNCTLMQSNIAVYEQNTKKPLAGAKITYDGNTRKLSIELPDATWCTVEYTLLFNTADVEGTNPVIKVQNKASLTGVVTTDSSITNQFQLFEGTAGAKGESGTYTLKKVDAENLTQSLKGAEFTLYRVDLDTSEPGALDTKVVDTQTTDASGTAVFKKDGSGKLAYDELYYFVETKAPGGFVKNETPYYFMLPGNEYAKNLAKAEKLVTGKVEKYEGANTIFTNQKISTTAVLEGTKTLKNGTVAAEEFTFILWRRESSDKRTQLQTVSNGAPDANGVAKFAFAPLTYTEAGTYNYVITEEQDLDRDDIVYDTSEYDVQVQVDEILDNSGHVQALKATVNFPAPVAFSNVKSVTVPIEGTKVLTGKAMKENEFTFVMLDSAGKEIARTTNRKPDAQGKATFRFNTPTFQTPGEYQYTIQEERGAVDGIAYDATKYTVTVTVDESMRATTVVTKKGAAQTEQALVFTNTYTAQARIEGTKQLSGAPIAAGDYSFALYEADTNGNVTGEALGTAQSDAKGSFAFTNSNTGNALSYSEAGTHYYVVREVVPEESARKPGVTYDEKDYFVTVQVVNDETGTLKATVKYPGDSLTVHNVYRASAKIQGEKVMSDGMQPTVGAYEFALYALNAEGAPEAAPIMTVRNETDGSFAFAGDKLTYATAGTWKYQVREVLPKDADGNVVRQKDGIVYDETVYDVTVTVAPDADGKLAATVDKTQEELRFTNVVRVQAEIAGTKTMNGAVPNPGAFTFVLYDKDNQVLAETSNDAQGEFVFTNDDTTNDSLSYTQPGTHQYTVAEKDTGTPGIVYDSTKYEVTVTVEKDSKTGGLTAKVSKDKKDLLFKNTGITSAVLGGTKRLLNATVTDGQFSFALYEAQDEKGTMASPTPSPLQTASNEGKVFAFKPIEYTAAGKYYYVIEELGGGTTKDGIYYDDSRYVAEVSVEEENDGTFVPTVRYFSQGSDKPLQAAPEFVNTGTRSYRARNASAAIAGRKLMEGMPDGTNMPVGMFYFDLYQDGNLIATASNAANGGFSFSLGALPIGTYNYTVKERNGGNTIDGITYDATEHQVQVVVTSTSGMPAIYVDGEIGYLRFTNKAKTSITVNKTWDDAENVAGERPESITVTLLENGVEKDVQTLSEATGWSYTWNDLLTRDTAYNKILYTVSETVVPNYTASVTATENTNSITYDIVNKYAELTNVFIDPIITKKLDGSVLQEAQFQFGLYDSADQLVSTATNKADGSVLFPSINFTAPGTYKYTIREIPGSDVHVDYSTTAVGATVQVVRDTLTEGGLLATVTYDEDGVPTTTPTITNTYSAIVLQVQKTSKDNNHPPLRGAVYALYRVNEGGTRDVLVGTCESDENGMMRYPDIALNQKYYFKEVSAPDGHTVDLYPTEVFWITQDSATGAIVILVENEEGNWVPSSDYGVSGSLPTPKNAASPALMRSETALPSDSGAQEPNAAQAAAPQGGIVITANGVSDARTLLVVAKLDTNTRAYLPGAKLQIIEKSSKNVVMEWTSGDAAYSVAGGLNVDEVYILREVSAPDGYEKAQDTEFSLDIAGNLTVLSGPNAESPGGKQINLYNTPASKTVVKTIYDDVVTQTKRIVNSPKTGDGAPIEAVLVFVLMVLAAIVYLEHRRYVKNKRK